MFSAESNIPLRRKRLTVNDKTVTLILPLEATTEINPSVSSAVTIGAISGVTAGELIY